MSISSAVYPQQCFLRDLPVELIDKIANLCSNQDALNLIEAWYRSRKETEKNIKSPRQLAEKDPYWFRIMQTIQSESPEEEANRNPAKWVFKFAKKYFGEPSPFSSVGAQLPPPFASAQKALRNGHDMAFYRIVCSNATTFSIDFNLRYEAGRSIVKEVLRKGWDRIAQKLVKIFPWILKGDPEMTLEDLKSAAERSQEEASHQVPNEVRNQKRCLEGSRPERRIRLHLVEEDQSGAKPSIWELPQELFGKVKVSSNEDALKLIESWYCSRMEADKRIKNPRKLAGYHPYWFRVFRTRIKTMSREEQEKVRWNPAKEVFKFTNKYFGETEDKRTSPLVCAQKALRNGHDIAFDRIVHTNAAIFSRDQNFQRDMMREVLGKGWDRSALKLVELFPQIVERSTKAVFEYLKIGVKSGCLGFLDKTLETFPDLMKQKFSWGLGIDEREMLGGDILLHIAAKDGQVKALKPLIERGADIHSKGFSVEMTPLHLTVWVGEIEAMKALIKLGANKEARDENGATPLYVAAFRGKGEIVKTLAELGADIEAKDKYGSTPLYMAAAQGCVEVVRLLLRWNVAIDIENVRGITPLEMARKTGGEVKHLLEAHERKILGEKRRLEGTVEARKRRR